MIKTGRRWSAPNKSLRTRTRNVRQTVYYNIMCINIIRLYIGTLVYIYNYANVSIYYYGPGPVG